MTKENPRRNQGDLSEPPIKELQDIPFRYAVLGKKWRSYLGGTNRPELQRSLSENMLGSDTIVDIRP